MPDSDGGRVRSGAEAYLLGVNGADTEIFVIGAGVIGLTSAICLAEAGRSVAVQAAQPSRATTSAVAGALWGTHLTGNNAEVPRWAGETSRVLAELMSEPAAGVHLAPGLMASAVREDTPPELPDSDEPFEYAVCPDSELPPGYVTGWRVSAPLVCMPDYLDYLRGRLVNAGGALLEERSFGSLAEAVSQTAARVILNCTGAGARDFVPDPEVTAVRGQVILAENPGLTDFFVGNGGTDDELTYFFPHQDLVLLGGTQQRGDWDREPDAATAERIFAACREVEPRLAGATILDHRAGLRPFRPQVRVEREGLGDGRHIVHNYGHGGAGVSLSWGTARDAASLATAALGDT
jgi:D-amino-acid oxidase